MKKRSVVKENAPTQWKIPPLCAADHKYTRGHVLVFGGAEMTGAARLCALAAQRAGAGLVTILAPRVVWPIYAASMLSVIVRPGGAQAWSALVDDARVNPVVIGPGAGTGARTRHALLAAARAGKTLVLDADALALLAADRGLRAMFLSLNPTWIATPHEGEYGRLAKALALDVTEDKPQRAQALAHALGAVVVLKGAQTYVANPQGGVTVTHPPPWLATAGTGDVLAGIIAALVGQGMAPFDAACAGAWLHAQAACRYGAGMIAEDVIAALPDVCAAANA